MPDSNAPQGLRFPFLDDVLENPAGTQPGRLTASDSFAGLPQAPAELNGSQQGLASWNFAGLQDALGSWGPADAAPNVTVEATFATTPGCGCIGCALGPSLEGSSAASGDYAENGSFATTTSVALSGNAGIDALLSGIRWSSTISYSDPDSSADYQSGYSIDTNGNGISAQFEGFSRISADMLAALQFTLDADLGNSAAAGFAIEGFTNLTINYAGAGSGAGTIRVANSSDAFTAYAFYPSGSIYGGDSFVGPDARNPSAAGNYSWFTIIHEMGHSLGLKHGHEPDFGGALPANLDSHEYSVMTYRSFVGGTTDYITWETWGAPQTFMMYDIAALQHMYGADFTTNSGNTTYTWSPTSGQTFINGAAAINPGANRIFATIWDGGGVDTYDLSNYSTNLVIDLTPGGHSVFSSAQLANLNAADWNGLGPQYARGNIFNALLFRGDTRSLIENATGGSGNDRLTGNSGNNLLIGNGGSDELAGRGGSDVMVGGAGDDTYFTDGGDTITENANEGTDTVRSWISFTLEANLENLVLNGTASLDVWGNTLANLLIGNSGNNFMAGRGGSDVMIGGAGNDTYVTDGGDTITENANEGTDTVQSWASFTLGANLENLILLGSSALDGWGNTQANVLTGNSGNNFLAGRGGSDVMIGGAGNDTYVTDGGDTITENANEGTDTVQSWVSYTLGANLENLVLLGSSALDGWGNSQANTLTGNSGNNFLAGRGGSDVMIGGAGNDTYVTDGGDTITENANQGTDTVQSWVTYALGANLENLTLLGTAAINGTGNSLANTIVGNTGANVLAGGLGNDTLTGDGGADSFVFDTALGAGNVDRIMDFNAVDDTIQLDDAIFTGLAVGALAATAFAQNTSGNADDANNRIIYETDTGNLYFDADGTGAAARVHFATLGLNLTLTSADFFVF